MYNAYYLLRSKVINNRCVKSRMTTATYIENLNDILERKTTETQIKQFLREFDSLKNEMSFKKGIYLYGSPGSGKTEFVLKILREMNYDAIKYDAGDIRNKNLIDSNITSIILAIF